MQCRIALLIDILQVSQTDIPGMLWCSMLPMIFGCSFLWCFFFPCFLLKLSFTFTCDSFFLFLLTLLLLLFFSFYSHIFTLLTLLPYYLKDYLEGLAVIRQWLLVSKFSFFSYFYSFQMLVEDILWFWRYWFHINGVMVFSSILNQQQPNLLFACCLPE